MNPIPENRLTHARMQSTEIVPLRPPLEVMSLARMGSAFPTRLSFMRILIRRMQKEGWHIVVTRFEMDKQGYGQAVYEARTPHRVYSLVAFSTPLDDDKRTDRVIAEAWDTTYTLYDGVVSEEELERLRVNTTRQEAGRFEPRDLVLSRANKSVRLFEYVCDCLASGTQPDRQTIGKIGYLMRTTAVYGNGKFGISDRGRICDRPEMRGPFQAEMLTVYLIRCFTHDLVEHVARHRGGRRFIPLDRDSRRILGIGNATGLGMAPFLINHPALIHQWMFTKERALGRVRNVPKASAAEWSAMENLLQRVRRHVAEWQVEDTIQTSRIEKLEKELPLLLEWICEASLTQAERPLDALYLRTQQSLSLETQELLVSILIELYPDLVDELELELSSSYEEELDPSWTVGEFRQALETHYAWTTSIDFGKPKNTALFWYTSEDKLEPRVGRRNEEPGEDRELPLAIARDTSRLLGLLADADPEESLAEFVLRNPKWRHLITRVQTVDHHPYGEIYDNVIADTCRPIDLLRCKLAFFGASKFDPKSDRWTRITLYQGAPLPDELGLQDADDWSFPTLG